MTARAGLAVATLVLVSSLLGCSSATEVAPSTLTDEASAAYRAAVADGVITEEEYTAGYRRFAACIRDAGWEFQELGRPSTTYDYGIPDDATLSGDRDECWNREFKQIEIIWFVNNPPTTEFGEKYVACLEAAGLPTDGNELELLKRMADNGIDAMACVES